MKSCPSNSNSERAPILGVLAGNDAGSELSDDGVPLSLGKSSSGEKSDVVDVLAFAAGDSWACSAVLTVESLSDRYDLQPALVLRRRADHKDSSSFLRNT